LEIKKIVSQPKHIGDYTNSITIALALEDAISMLEPPVADLTAGLLCVTEFELSAYLVWIEKRALEGGLDF